MGALDKYKIEEEEGSYLGVNKETLPTPPAERTWSQWDFIAVWSGPSFDINQWNIGSSFINVGLTVTQCCPPVIIGSLFAAVAITLMGMPGAKYHIGFPSLIRSTFGVGGAKWVVLLRGLVGVIWYAVEALYVGYMVKIMLRCMFGYKWNDWLPVMGASSGGASAQLILAFFIAWLIIFPLVFVVPRKLAFWFNARSIIGPIVYFALFGWCAYLGLHKPGESFPGFSFQQTSLTTSSAKAWAFLSGVNSIVASIAPQCSNVSDITRYASRPKAAGWPQGAAFFATKVLSVFLGILATSFLTFRYNLETPLWNIWDQLDLILDNEWSAKSRFGCFIIALGFGFSSTMTNAYANTVPFAADVSSLFPKWISFKRGQFIIAAISPACVPWMLFTSGAKFLTLLGSYTFFMASVTGPILVDFYILRRGIYHVPSFYDRDISSIYCFNSRIRNNWRGFVGFISGIAMVLPGLIEAYMPSKVGSPASRMYSSGWVISLSTSAFIYYATSKLFPVPLLPPGNEELAARLKFCEMAETHGHLLKDELPPYAMGEAMWGGASTPLEEDASSEEKGSK